MIRPEEPCEFSVSAEKSVSISVKTFIYLFFLGGDHLFLGKKTVWISDIRQKTVSISDNPRKSDSRSIKIWLKVADSCLSLSKKPRPFFQILATRLDFHLFVDQSLTVLGQLAYGTVIKGSGPCIFDLDPDLAR